MDTSFALKNIFNSRSLQENTRLRACLRKYGGGSIPMQILIALPELATFSEGSIRKAVTSAPYLSLQKEMVSISAARIETEPPEPFLSDEDYPPLHLYRQPQLKKKGKRERWADVKSDDSHSTR